MHVPGPENYLANGVWNHNSGKSATAEVICDIWGGTFKIEMKDKPEDVNKKLLSDSGLSKRAVFLDNLKGKTSCAFFESFLTSKTIEGHRMYLGYYSRPNILTWFLTSNSPKLSEDMAVRTVAINIGKQQHEKAWVEEASNFVREHRWEIVHDCLLLLRSPPRGRISPAFRDRFQSWQDAVLCRSSDKPDKLACLIAERRGEVNEDAHDAQEVADAICKWLRTEKHVNPFDCDKIRITREEMRKLLIAAEIIEPDFGKRAVRSWLDELRGSAPLKALTDVITDQRVWVWDPSRLDPSIVRGENSERIPI